MNEQVTKKDCNKTSTAIMNEIKDMRGEIKDLNRNLSDFKTELKEIIAIIPYQVYEKTMEESDRRYASKLTQKIVYGLVSLILLTFGGAIIALAFNQ